MQDINGIIDGIVKEKTFSLEAVEAIKKMREELISAKHHLEEAAKELDFAKNQRNEIQEHRDTISEELVGFKKREEELIGREVKMTRIECDLEKEKAVKDAVQGCFELVFKNVTVRQNIQRNVGVPVDGGPQYGGMVQDHLEGETKETTQE